ncbi:MAG TPA: TRAP transporter large permease [Dongiaceae bacterium]
MTWWALLLAAFGLILSLFASGLPVFACFLLANVVGVLALIGPAGLGLFVNSILDTTTTEALVAVPLYVLLGELLFCTGGITALYSSLNRLVGAIPGRLYVIATMLAAFLGAVSGSAMASVAMLGRFIYPTMIERGCDRRLSIGTILAGATLDPIIPPSVLAIILATLANISIASFLIAGIVPGLLLAGLFALYAVARTVFDPALDARIDPMPSSERGWWQLIASVLQILPLCFIIFLVLGLIILGVAQPTEAAATGVIGIVLIAMVTRSISWQTIYQACYGAAITTATILVILASAKLFSQLLAYTGATAGLIGLVSDLEINRWAVYVIMMATVFVFCMFMDQLALMLIAVPVYSPLIAHFGFDPIWFWMLFLINITLGGITPPFGYTMFVFKSVTPDVPLLEVYRAAWPMVWIAVFGMVIMTFIPQIVTWLPSAGH